MSIIQCWVCHGVGTILYGKKGEEITQKCCVCKGSGEFNFVEEPRTNFMPSSSEEEHEENIGSHIPEENNSPEKDHGKGEK